MNMDITLIFLLTMVGTVIAATLWMGRWPALLMGLKRAFQLFRSIWLRLIFGFTLGGLIKVLIPSSLITDWLGPASGLKGILIASYTGLVMTGGPYVTYPIAVSLYDAGAGVGPILAFLVSTTTVSIPGLFTWSIPFLGTRLALTRYVICFFIPPIVGLGGGMMYQLITSV